MANRPDLTWVIGSPFVERGWARDLGKTERDEVLGEARAVEEKRFLRGHALLPQRNAWLIVPLGKGWTAAYRLAVQDGAVVVGELRVFPRERPLVVTNPRAAVRIRPPEGAAALREWPTRIINPGEWSAAVLGIEAKVPPGGLMAKLLRQVKVLEHLRVADQVLRHAEEHLVRPLRLSAPSRPRPGIGRPRRPDLWYARIAQAYAEAVRQSSRHPVVDVAAATGLSLGRARDAIHEARLRKLLTPVLQGRPGGQLTPQAWALLGDGQRARRKRSTRERTG